MTMIMQWMLYCIALSIALAVGARFLEAAARAGGRSTRWCWAIALIASVLLPYVSYMRPVHVTSVETPVSFDVTSAPSSTQLPQNGLNAATTRMPAETGALLWATSSLLSLVIVGISYVRLLYARRSWTPAEISGIAVWLSEDTGPAALGVLKSGIVLPRWVLSFEERSLSLMMLHEREHLRSGDPRLMLLSVLLVAAMPWNPVAWIMVRRLRLAIEVDCDQRVLSREPDFVAYGAVLLEVGRHRSSPTFALSTFAEPRSQLEERIRRISERSKGTRRLRAAAMLVLALPLGGAASAMHAPMHARVIVDEPAASSGAESAADTTAPRILNPAHVFKRLITGYPPVMRRAGIEGSVWLSCHVLSNGLLDIVSVAAKSRHPALDSAAVRIIRDAQFSPAKFRGRSVQGWTKVQLTFAIDQEKVGITTESNGVTHRFPPGAHLQMAGVGIRQHAQGEPGKSQARLDSLQRSMVRQRLARAAAALEKAPYVTPMTVRPKLVNQGEVEAAITDNYPENLRDAGVGGKTIVWFFIDASGSSKNQRINTSSGNEEIDGAAMKVASVLRFTPAEHQGRKVPVWVMIPIVFNSRSSTPSKSASPTTLSTRLIPEYVPGQTPLSAAPAFTPMTIRPKLLNFNEVKSAIAEAYPKLLKDAGIGGKTTVWFFIDQEGRNVKPQVQTSSGYDALDAAAIRVARVLRFSPAEHQGRRVPVWVAIPIVFTPN